MNLLSQLESNIFVQHKTKPKTIQTWTLSGADVCLEDPRRLCKEKLLLFLIEAFEHPLKPETKFEYLQFLNICNVWTSAMFEHRQCLNIYNVWTSAIFENLQWLNICNFWISAVMNICDNQIYTLLLPIHIQMFAKIVGYWEKFCPLNLFLVANCSSPHANSRFHNKISWVCFTRLRWPRYPGKYCSCF